MTTEHEPLVEITLPLPPDVSRCLGHDGRLGNHCPKANICARHVTIRHAGEPWDHPDMQDPRHNACSDDTYACFIEVPDAAR